MNLGKLIKTPISQFPYPWNGNNTNGSHLWGLSEGGNEVWQCKTETGLLEVFLREGLLTLPFLPDAQILSTLSWFWHNKKQCFQVLFHTRGQSSMPPCPSRAPRECPSVPSSSSMYCIPHSVGPEAKAKEESHRGPTTKGHTVPTPNPNGTSTLSSDLPFLYALSCSTCCKASPNF